MQNTNAKLQEIKLVGVKCRTNNASEQDPTKAKIGAILQQYFNTAVSQQITNRIAPGTTYCVYTEYDNDHNGDYTYFIGEAVSTFSAVPQTMSELCIPAQNYMKITNGPGSMPEVCINIWKKIWDMTPEEFGGARSYLADFEIYDSRAADPSNAVLDVYVGLK